MCRLLVAAAVLTASMLLPAAALADSPHRVYISEGGGTSFDPQQPSACLGPVRELRFTFSSVADGGKSTLIAKTSNRTALAHVHGTVSGQFWTTLGDQDAPHLYDGSIDLRVNDTVTANFPTVDLPQGYVAHPVVVDMIPVAGGPTVTVSTEIQIWVVWHPDGTIFTSVALGLVSCA